MYVFVLVFLFPILNCLKYLLVNLVVLLSPYLKKKEMKQDNTKSSLVRMSMSQTVSSLISSSGINASYPTVAWLVIRRAGNEKNLFGTIASLYFNNNWRSEANMRNMFYFYRAGFSCGTDSKRAIVWSLYYNKLVLKQLPGNVENNVYISYK